MTIDELEAWFNGRELPTELVINRSTKMTNVPRSVKTHIAIVKKYGKDHLTFSSFYTRLVDLKLMLEVM